MRPLPTTPAALEAKLRQRRLFLSTLGKAYQDNDIDSVHHLLADFISTELTTVYTKQHAKCDAFNALCPVGGQVLFRFRDEDDWTETITSGKAFVSGEVAIVFLKGIDGRCCLTHIKILVQV